MSAIDKLLQTREGAISLKEKLKAMPKAQKQSDAYQSLWKRVNDAVNAFNTQLEREGKYQAPKVIDGKAKQQLQAITNQGADDKNQQQDTKTTLESKDTDKERKKRSYKSSRMKLSSRHFANPFLKEKHQAYLEQKRQKEIDRLLQEAEQRGEFLSREVLDKKKSYSTEEISQTLDKLRQEYPKVFNPKYPKPLSIGIDRAVIKYLDIEHALVQAAIQQHVRSELYNIAFFNAENRYNLLGRPVSKIEPKEKEFVKRRLNNALGRFEMQKKYPALLPQYDKTPKPTKKAKYGCLYYRRSLNPEVAAIVLECYGNKARLAFDKSKSDDGIYHCTAQVIVKGKTLFMGKGKADNKDDAKFNATLELYLTMKEEIDIYPFNTN